jgi:His-Xaa-Ser system protein HxsD
MSKQELKLEKKDGFVILKINPVIYPLDVIYSAAYVFLDKAYIILGGEPNKEIIVSIKSKDGKDNKIALEFYNELVVYLEYKQNFENNKEIRKTLLQVALLGSESTSNLEKEAPQPNSNEGKENYNDLLKELEEDTDDFLDDPDGIAIPWEEKYGKKKPNKITNKKKKAKK